MHHRKSALAFLVISLVISLVVVGPVAQAQIIKATYGSVSGERYGTSVRGIGDWNHDGVPDVIVGGPFDNTGGAGSGSATVVSGKTGEVLLSLFGQAVGEHFGTSVSSAGDVNQDGVVDLLVGAPEAGPSGPNSGSARIFSGKDGAVLFTFNGQAAGDQFGTSVDRAGDVDGDGYADVIVGAPNEDLMNLDSGSARVFSGRTGAVLFTLGALFTNAVDHFGTAVAGAGDVNHDGFADVIVGAPDYNGTTVDEGAAEVYLGPTGAALYRFTGAFQSHTGTAVNGVGDVNGDGFDDLAFGAPHADSTDVDDCGLVKIRSGADGSTLQTFFGLGRGDQFGASVAGTGDLDGDGLPDVVIGAPSGSSYATGEGAVWVRSATGKVIAQLRGSASKVGFGSSVDGLDDADGDERPDLVVGAPFDNVSGAAVVCTVKPELQWTASGIRTFGYALHGAGDVNGDGRPDVIVGAFDVIGQGKAQLLSGQDGTLLHEFAGSPFGSDFGSAVGGGQDVNGDQVPDVIIADTAFPLDEYRGLVTVYSGADYSLLYQIEGTPMAILGSQVAFVGDLDGDGRAEFAASGLDANGEESVFVYAGRDGSVLFHILRIQHSSGFGVSIDAAGDVNRDGIPDLIVGASRERYGGYAVGAAHVFSGKDGSEILRFPGSGFDFSQVGQAVCGAGDVNADGFDDLGVGAPGIGSTSASVFSGRDGSLLRLLEGPNPSAIDQFGYAMAGAGDLDRDGFDDVAVGAPDHSSGELSKRGLLVAYSGASGAALAMFRGEQNQNGSPGWGLGRSVAGIGDADGDGYPDLVSGAPARGDVYLYSVVNHLSSAGTYGKGWPGTKGVPSIAFDSNLVTCSDATLELGNSLGATTRTWMVVGFESAELPTAFGGTLLVRPLLLLTLDLPAAGIALPVVVPCDPQLGGRAVHVQILEQDAGASRGLSFSAGLQAFFRN